MANPRYIQAQSFQLGSGGASAGATSITLQPGFILAEGVEFTVGGVTGIVSSIDEDLGIINLLTPMASGASGVTPLSLVIASDQLTEDRTIAGINNFDLIYDDGLISKTKTFVY